MSRMVGTVSRGIRAPIIRNGDDLVDIVTTSVLDAAASEDGFAVRDRDIVAMTEAIVARAQGNYVSVDDIAEEVYATIEECDDDPMERLNEIESRLDKISKIKDSAH